MDKVEVSAMDGGSSGSAYLCGGGPELAGKKGRLNTASQAERGLLTRCGLTSGSLVGM
jgi:hypothetical protein